PAGGFSPHGRLRGNVEEYGDSRHRKSALNLLEPGDIESLRLTVGDRRGPVAVADDEVPCRQPLLHLWPPFESIRDVQKLHHIRCEIPLSVEGPTDLAADRRLVVGEGRGPHDAAVALEPRSQRPRLRFLPALIEAFERNQHHSSHCSMSSIVCRRRTTRQVPPSTITSAAAGRRL